VHSTLTSKRASRRIEGGGVDAEGMRAIWDGLDSCWEEFDSLRRSFGSGNIVGEVDLQVERFVSGWQVGAHLFGQQHCNLTSSPLGGI
jgi:hypothetical protein